MYIYDITYLFECSKYERDLRYQAYAFTKSFFSVTEKLTYGALVTPNPGYEIVAVALPGFAMDW